MKYATLQEMMKALVQTDDQMERMSIVEENQELLTVEQTTSEEPTEWETKYNELKQKYIERFFGGKAEEEEPKEEPTEEEKEEKKAENITIEDVLKGDNK